MKRFSSILFFLLCLSLYAKSQITFNLAKLKNVPVIMGFEAGLNLSTLQLEKSNMDYDKNDPKYLVGYKIGLNFTYVLNSTIDFETGILLMHTGQKKDFYYVHDVSKSDIGSLSPSDTISYSSNGSESYRFNHIKFPLRVNVTLNNLILSCGGYFSVLAGGKYTYHAIEHELYSNQLLSDYGYTEKAKLGSANKFDHFVYMKTFSSIDLGLNFGIGYKVGRFIIKSTIDYGLYDVIKQKPETDLPVINFKQGFTNKAITLSFLYYFSKKYYNRIERDE